MTLGEVTPNTFFTLKSVCNQKQIHSQKKIKTNIGWRKNPDLVTKKSFISSMAYLTTNAVTLLLQPVEPYSF